VSKKESFITAIKNNEGIIYKIAAVYTNDVHDKNDLVQEIIYQLWKSFDSFDQRSALSTWMYRVAMNVAVYHLKTSKRKINTVSLQGEFTDIIETENAQFEEKLQIFRTHLNNLNLLDKGIVMLYLEDKSYEEIAQIIGISASNVGTKLSRIKEKLRTQIIK
jgi:RNA polymerase sigma-70 factor (ECF subfamily)